MIHDLDAEAFLAEQGIEKLGAGSEGAVYFLRGHVVKLVESESVGAALREIAHLLFLNPTLGSERVMGQRTRGDWPNIVWIYLLSDGSLAIGMRTFDPEDVEERGCDLHRRLHVGPELDRTEAIRVLRELARTLAYMHGKGIIHHDLKPENIWLPADATRPPIVFDLSQALWQQSSFGADWVQHNYNRTSLYNGTYRYMHHLRRVAHLGAADLLAGQPLTKTRRDAIERYAPSPYDDVFAFARILRAFVLSPQVALSLRDKRLVKVFYRQLMGLKRKRGREGEKGKKVPITARIMRVFKRKESEDSAPKEEIELVWPSMSAVIPELDRVLRNLEAHASE